MNLPKHKFWGAGEPGCPPELKAPNGELHTMRCKVCGDGWRKSVDVCFGAAGLTMTREEVLRIAEACGLGSLREHGWWAAGLADPAQLVEFARVIAAGAAGVSVGGGGQGKDKP
jgi:hypothetical protein